MASYLLDTHACVFALRAPRKLGRRAVAALKRVESGADAAWLPAATVAEVILLHEMQRIEIGLEQLVEVMDDGLWRFLPIDLEQLDVFASLAAIRDPFDRLIVSAARSVGAKLISRDTRLVEGGFVQTVWD